MYTRFYAVLISVVVLFGVACQGTGLAEDTIRCVESGRLYGARMDGSGCYTTLPALGGGTAPVPER